MAKFPCCLKTCSSSVLKGNYFTVSSELGLPNFLNSTGASGRCFSLQSQRNGPGRAPVSDGELESIPETRPLVEAAANLTVRGSKERRISLGTIQGV